jgi:hypothetical protein
VKKIVFILGLMFSFSATAEVITYQCGDDCTATLDTNSGTMHISGTGVMYNYNSNTRYETPWYNSRSKITSVIVEDGITSVGRYSFFNCYNIQNIELPHSLEKVDTGAFDEDSRIESITMFDTTLWKDQDNMNEYSGAPDTIKISCYGNLTKCQENFSQPLKRMKSTASFNHKGKKIYTVDEATAVVKDNKNTFSIIYR